MTTSSNTIKREKLVTKRATVTPSNYHLDKKQYAGVVTLGGDSIYTAWFNEESEAKYRLEFLKIALDYDSYQTMEGEGVYPERAIIMEELYQKSGRDSKDHPMHGLFTGLAKEYGKVPDNNTK